MHPARLPALAAPRTARPPARTPPAQHRPPPPALRSARRRRVRPALRHRRLRSADGCALPARPQQRGHRIARPRICLRIHTWNAGASVTSTQSQGSGSFQNCAARRRPMTCATSRRPMAASASCSLSRALSPHEGIGGLLTLVTHDKFAEYAFEWNVYERGRAAALCCRREDVGHTLPAARAPRCGGVELARSCVVWHSRVRGRGDRRLELRGAGRPWRPLRPHPVASFLHAICCVSQPNPTHQLLAGRLLGRLAACGLRHGRAAVGQAPRLRGGPRGAAPHGGGCGASALGGHALRRAPPLV